jgi:hypothetical protein
MSSAVSTHSRSIHPAEPGEQAGAFLTWLADRGRTLGSCRQADLDEWLSSGPTTRHTVRTFIVWTTKQKLARVLTIGFRPARTSPLLTQDDRLHLLARCLTGEPDTLAYRVAAVLLLLYAQPLQRIAALRTEDVHVAPTEIRIKLGDHPAALPEPFAQLLRDHLTSRPNLRTANTGGSPWLFPSTRADQHLDPSTIRTRPSPAKTDAGHRSSNLAVASSGPG